MPHLGVFSFSGNWLLPQGKREPGCSSLAVVSMLEAEDTDRHTYTQRERIGRVDKSTLKLRPF